MSRTPVRAALERLASDGLVEMSPNKGAAVANMSLEQSIEVLRIRQALEELACRLAAEHMTEDDISRLRELVALMEKCVDIGDLYEYSRLNNEFHQSIARASRSARLAELVDLMKASTMRQRIVSLLTPGRTKQSLEEHRRIVDALEDSIESGDSTIAEEAMRAHLQGMLQSLMWSASKSEGMPTL